MDKLNAFRKLNTRLPSVVEQILTRWGTPDLDGYINQAMSEAAHSSQGLAEELSDSLVELKKIHAVEFPQYATSTTDRVAEKLAGNPDFQIINGRFPHIGAKIIATWGHLAFDQYMDTLFNDCRDGKRKGFPEEVAFAIFRLKQEHDAENPEAVPKTMDIWEQYHKE